MTAIRTFGVFTFFLLAVFLPFQISVVVQTTALLQVVLWLTVVPFTWVCAFYTAKIILEMWND